MAASDLVGHASDSMQQIKKKAREFKDSGEEAALQSAAVAEVAVVPSMFVVAC